MNEEQTYKKLAKLLLKRLITLEKDANKLQNELETNTKNHIIKVYVETNDIVPLLEISDLLEKEDAIFQDLSNIINNCEYKNLDNEIEKIFNKYIYSNTIKDR